MNYKNLNDYELLSMLSENENAHNSLYLKYKPLISKIAKKMKEKNKNIEYNDFIQEGYIGLSHAIKHYDEEKNILFFTYAKFCIEKAMLSYITGSKRQKHKILNESISMEALDEQEFLNSLDRVVQDDSLDPSNIVFDNESKQTKYENLKKILTTFEEAVLDLRYYGFEYKEIAQILEKDEKAIDNAMQRIRSKAKKIE